MKLVKRITLIILLVLGFSMQCEVFQLECWDFSTAYYLSSVFTYNSEEERIALLEDVSKYTKEAGIDVFATDITSENEFKNLLTIFGNENVEKVISETNNIESGLFTSLISGQTTVVYKDFAELSNEENKFINCICYVGEPEKIYDVHKKMREKYELDFPEIISASERDMIYVVWVSLALIMIVFTCIEIIYKKKEVVVRISLGQSTKKLIQREILEEFIWDVIIFLVVRFVVFRFVLGEFMKDEVAFVYGCGMMISCLCYMAYAFYDIKKAFHNVNDSAVILGCSYVLKVLVTVLSMFTLVTNFNNIMANALIDYEAGLVNTYGDYSYINIRDKADNSYNGKRISSMKIFKNIFREYYSKVTPTILIKEMVDTDNNLTYICVNEHGKDMLGEFIIDEKMLDGVDAIYFIPKHANYDKVVEDAEWLLNMMIANMNGINIKVVRYDDTKYLSCIDTNSAYGVKTVKNPVVVYSNYNGTKNPKNVTAGVEDMNIRGIMFKLSEEDITEINTRYKIAENGYEMVTTTVMESYETHNTFVKKLIAFCSSLCVLTIIMQLVLIIAVNNMQYRRNAIEISIKKILGYSLWKRHRKILCSSILMYIVITVLMIAAGVVTGIMQPYVCVIVGIIMLVIELAVIIMNIIQIENNKIQKTLKGGCL